MFRFCSSVKIIKEDDYSDEIVKEKAFSNVRYLRYESTKDFNDFGDIAKTLGLIKVNSGPLVRSSYHAEESY